MEALGQFEIDQGEAGDDQPVAHIPGPRFLVVHAPEIIYGHEGIAAHWRERLVEWPALDLEELHVEGGAVVVSYRTSSGIVRALLDIAEDGMITRCRCGPI